MAKMVSLKRSKADREKDALRPIEGGVYPEDEGPAINLEHHHLAKLGLGGSLKSGDDVEFLGRGKVERSETRTDKDGERHSATIRLHRGAVDHEPAERDNEGERGELRSELAKNVAASEAKNPGK